MGLVRKASKALGLCLVDLGLAMLEREVGLWGVVLTLGSDLVWWADGADGPDARGGEG